MKRHFPQRFWVSEPGSDSKEELCISFDDECNHPTRVVAASSGSILWDRASGSEEQFEQIFEGLQVEPADLADDAVERLPTPPPARSSYRQAVIGILRICSLLRPATYQSLPGSASTLVTPHRAALYCAHRHGYPSLFSHAVYLATLR